MVPDTWKILDAAAPEQHNGMLLEVMANARDIGGDFDTMGKANTGNLPEGRVRLLRGDRHDAGTNAAFLRALIEGRALGLPDGLFAAHPNQLVNGRH
jgi:hypothetical protein